MDWITIERIKTLHPGVKILVSSIYEESVYAERALRSGALGYVNKQASPTSLISAILRPEWKKSISVKTRRT